MSSRHSSNFRSRAGWRESTRRTWNPRAEGTTSLISETGRLTTAVSSSEGELAPPEGPHEASLARFGRARAGLREGLEALGVRLQPAPNVPGLALRRDEDLAECDRLGDAKVLGMLPVVRGDLFVGHADAGKNLVGEELLGGYLLLLGGGTGLQEAAGARLENEDPFLEKGLEKGGSHASVDGSPARLEGLHVTVELAPAHRLSVQGQDDAGPRAARLGRPGRPG